MSSWVKLGVKCVCINAKGLGREYNLLDPVEGQVLTVRRIDLSDPRGAILWFCEITNPSMIVHDWKRTTRTDEPGYAVERFRPLVTKTQEQDVEMFLSLLTKQSERA